MTRQLTTSELPWTLSSFSIIEMLTELLFKRNSRIQKHKFLRHPFECLLLLLLVQQNVLFGGFGFRWLFCFCFFQIAFSDSWKFNLVPKMKPNIHLWLLCSITPNQLLMWRTTIFIQGLQKIQAWAQEKCQMSCEFQWHIMTERKQFISKHCADVWSDSTSII